jgi:hypothetical protein
MDVSFAGPLPAPSAAWSHVAASQQPGELDAKAAGPPSVGGVHVHMDAAAGLRARLLNLIVTADKNRKAASAESNRPR